MKAIFLVLIIIISAGFGFAQDVVNADLNACELNSLHFDMIANRGRSEREKIFVIFRAGKQETEVVNARRLSYVKNFLLNGKGWKSLDVIYARGEKTNDAGKIEFYVGGKFFLIVISPKNKTPCLDCCENPRNEPQNLLKLKKGKKIK